MEIKYIFFVVLFVVIITIVSASLGLIPGTPVFQQGDPGLPQGGWAVLWNTIVYFVHCIGFFLSLVVFQVPGVPIIVNSIITFPIMATLLYIIARAVRG